MRKIKMTIPLKVLAITLAAFLILTPVFSVVLMNQVESAMLNELKISGTSIADLTIGTLNSTDLKANQDRMQELGKIENMVYALEIDKDFKAVAHSNPDRVGKEFKDPGTESAMGGTPYAGKYYSKDRKAYIYDIILPIKRTYDQFTTTDKTVDQLQHDFDTLNGSIENVSRSMEDIMRAVQIVSDSRKVVDEGMADMAAVIQETSAITEETSAGIEEQLAAFEEINQMSTDLHEAAVKLNKIIDRVKI